MRLGYLILGFILLPLNIAIAGGLPFYLSSLPQNIIEMIQVVYVIMGIASILIGVVDK